MAPYLPTIISFFTNLFTPPPPSSPAVWKTPSKAPKEGHYTNTPLRRAIPSTPCMYILQTHSPLFAKLPLELRSIIWSHVMGSHTIHLHYEGDAELRSVACGAQRLHACGSAAHGGSGFGKCRPFPGSGKMTYRGMVGTWDMGWVNVMRVCRAMYFETSRTLYSASIFDLSDCWTQAPSLPWTIPLASLSQISCVSVTILDLYAAPGVIGYGSWQALWTTLDLLRGLKDLHVEIATKEKYDKATMKKEDFAKVEEELLGYLKMLETVPGRKKARWELILPCEEKEGGSEIARELARSGWMITRK